MQELAWHMMLRLDDDRVLAPSVHDRRLLARTVYRIADERGLLCFGAADTHLHLVVLCSRENAGRLAQQLGVALRAQLHIPVPFAPARIVEVRDQHHLRNVFHYVLGQRGRHGLHSDPFLDASSLPELLGLRVLRTDSGDLVRELLPRVSRRDLLRHLSLEALEPCSALVAPLDAAAGAVGLGSLDQSRELGRLGRAALVQLGTPQLASGALAQLIGRSEPTVRRLRQVEVPPRLMRAVRLQLALRQDLLGADGEPGALTNEWGAGHRRAS